MSHLMSSIFDDYVDKPKNPCDRVPCCEACGYMNGYQFEAYNRIVCMHPDAEKEEK